MMTVEGIYKNGKIELLEKVSNFVHSKVLITFLETSDIDLKTLGISEKEAQIAHLD